MEVKEGDDPEKIIETLKEKKKCIKCFKTSQYNHKCPPANDKFLCIYWVLLAVLMVFYFPPPFLLNLLL